MIRLTTPRHIFTFPQDPSTYDKILITYKQGNKIILEKTEEDMTFSNDNSAYITLTQEETKAFSSNINVQVQVRVLQGMTAFASNITSVSVGNVLNEGVLE